ncbi:glycosyltransferase [Ammoniphilus oxalaticus]|nr:glycosyltransferase [Ammoniphilus oxalaticus]
MKISVIIPTLNEEQTISQTVKSLQSQQTNYPIEWKR